MTSFKLTTWNINSVRLRAPRVVDFIEREAPDVICLQEIKCREAEFPTGAFSDKGYKHIDIKGQKGLHGVAIISRLPIEALETPDFCKEEHARVQAVRVAGVEVHNIYLPAGGDEPDPEMNPKFAHKLDFVSRMESYYSGRRAEPNPLVVVGDLNIAPHENDVWSHKQLLKVVSHTPIETEGLTRVIEAGGFNDIARSARKDEEKLYTWWSYRARDWAASNRGRRLDHIWSNTAATPLADFSSYTIHQAERGGEKPSDHAPVSVSFKSA